MKKIICVMICIIVFAAVIPTASSLEKDSYELENVMEKKLEKKYIVDNYELEDDFVVMQNPPDMSGYTDRSLKPVPMNTPDEFSWLDYMGGDWTTVAKNQGNCGSCWDFGALGVFESKIEIAENCPELNPDLSEQYVLSCLSNAGSCRGGNSYKALTLIKETTPEGNNYNGVVPESCFEYQTDDDIPCSEKCTDWVEKLIPLSDYSYWRSYGTESDIESIKTQIMQDGPVITHIKATDPFKTWGALNNNPDAYYPDFRKVLGYNHIVMIVGWKDISSIATGGYWICKNSWGTNWGYNGFFNIAYNSLNIDNCAIIDVVYDEESIDWPPIVDTGGPYGTYLGDFTNFDASESIGVESEIALYEWDFADQTGGFGETINHKYTETGVYDVKLKATDSDGNSQEKTTKVWVQESNNEASKPNINGPNSGTIGKPYNYYFSSNDPEGNDIYYIIKWGDQDILNIYGPYESGEEIELSHKWTKMGSYTIKAKSMDVFGDESDWKTFTINLPRNKANNNYYIDSIILEIYNKFPVLVRLINLMLKN